MALFAGALLGAEDLPDWARQAVDQTVPKYPVSIGTAVLFHEENVAVEANGACVMRERGVIEVLQAGAGAIAARRRYNSRTGRIRDFRGWLRAPGGTVARLEKDRILDVALSLNETYNEARARISRWRPGRRPVRYLPTK